MKYSKILLDSIEREKAGTDFQYTDADRVILLDLIKEINKYAQTNFQYLAELDAFDIQGTGEIIAKYITKFTSESIRGYLISKLVADKVKDCDKLILQLYLHFKASNEYIPHEGASLPAHIYVRYDNAFKQLKSKRLKGEFMELMSHPIDAFYLPFTMRMLASWKIPEFKKVLLSYLSEDVWVLEDKGFGISDDKCSSIFVYIKRELLFTALEGLKYYPSPDVKSIIQPYTESLDVDIRIAARKTMKVIEKYSKETDI